MDQTWSALVQVTPGAPSGIVTSQGGEGQGGRYGRMGRGQGLYTQRWKKGSCTQEEAVGSPATRAFQAGRLECCGALQDCAAVGPGSPTMGSRATTKHAQHIQGRRAGRGGKAQQTGSPAMGGERDSFVEVHQLRRLVRRGGGLPHHPLGIGGCQHQPSKASSVPLAKGGRGPHQGSRASQRQRTRNPARWR